MKKKIIFAVLLLAMVAMAGIMALAGCGSNATSSSTSSSTSLNDAITSDPSLFYIGDSDPTGDLHTSRSGAGSSIMSAPLTEEARSYSWWRTFDSPSSIKITNITVEAASAEVLVTREVTGVLNVKMTSGATATTESFSQSFSRYINLILTNESWKIDAITQGVSRSKANGSSTSVTSDITIDSVSIFDTTSMVTYEITSQASAEGPWIDYENIATTEQSHVLQVTVHAEQAGNLHGPVPFVYIWPDLSGTSSFFRHQMTFNYGSTFTYSFTVPGDEPHPRRRHMVIGAFCAQTLASDEATVGPYDFTSWHIPYKVQ
jgi:hypothetical protein